MSQRRIVRNNFSLFLLLVSFHSRMPIERFTFQLRMESLGRLDASFSVGATQQWRITLLCCSTRTTLAHKPQHLLHCVRISERPENTDQQHNFSFIGLKSPQFSILFNSQFIKKGHKNFQLRRISVGWLSGIFPWNQWRLGSPLCHWWHKQLWRLTISTPRKIRKFFLVNWKGKFCMHRH